MPANQAQLQGVLTFHVVPGRLSAADLRDGQTLTTVNGETLMVTKANGQVMVGNANGMGAADYLTRRLYGQIDFEATYLNGLTDPATTLDVSLPPVMPNDLGAISMALLKGNTFDAKPRVVRIRDTLNLDRLLVSPAVLEEITGRTEFTVLTQPEPIAFDREGNLADQYQIWQEF